MRNLGQISSLTELDLSANSISQVVGPESLVCLKSFNLANNMISEIPAGALNSLVSLENFNVS